MTTRRPPDPAEIAVIGHALHSVAVEMGAALRRTAFSPNIKERRDYSCAVFSTRPATLIAMGDDMPVHLGSMPMSVARRPRRSASAARRRRHSQRSLSRRHASARHHHGGARLHLHAARNRKPRDFYVANRAHHADVGGMYPGSMGPVARSARKASASRRLSSCAPAKWIPRLLAAILNNVRTPEEREGDLHRTAWRLPHRRGPHARTSSLASHTRRLRQAFAHARRSPSADAQRPRHLCPPVNGTPKIFSTTMASSTGPIAFAVKITNNPQTPPRR